MQCPQSERSHISTTALENGDRSDTGPTWNRLEEISGGYLARRMPFQARQTLLLARRGPRRRGLSHMVERTFHASVTKAIEVSLSPPSSGDSSPARTPSTRVPCYCRLKIVQLPPGFPRQVDSRSSPHTL